MESKHKAALKAYKTELCEGLTLTEVLVFMESRNILTGVQIGAIKAHPAEYNRNEAFIDTLPKCGSNAYPTLITALQRSNQKHLAEELEKVANSVGATAAPTGHVGYQHDYDLLKHETLPVAVRNEIQKSVLQLPKTIRDTASIIDYMQAYGALTDPEADRLKALQPQTIEIVRRIIDILKQAPVHNFVRFLEALDISDQQNAKSSFKSILGKEFPLGSTTVIFS